MPSDAAAYAANWRTVLVVDAALGLAVVAAGVVAALAWSAVLGVLGALAGGAYVALVARRWVRWRRLRAAAGVGDVDAT